MSRYGQMVRLECWLVGALIGVWCPLSLLVLGWWGGFALYAHGVGITTDGQIAVAALGGLGAGVLLDVVGLRWMLARFYRVGWKWVAPFYLWWAAIATAWFMGAPIGTLGLGLLAGLYLGRRMRYVGLAPTAFPSMARRISALVALVTGASALGIGVLVLMEPRSEPFVMARVAAWLEPRQHHGVVIFVGVVLLTLVVSLLVWLQYQITRRAAQCAFNWGGARA